MSGGNIGVRIQESAHFRIVIPTLQIIQLSFPVVDIATVQEGVVLADGIFGFTGDGEHIAPGVVGVFHHCLARGVQNVDDVALEVADIVVSGDSGSVVDPQSHGAGGIVEEDIAGIGPDVHLAQSADATYRITYFLLFEQLF